MRHPTMAGFIDEICASPLANERGTVDYKAVSRRAIKEVLPIIIENDLTPRQRECIELKYYQGKTQSEIAQQLLLTQPTVSHHIKTAQEIIKNRLYYCDEALKSAQKLVMDDLY